jgi:hypothetical protein
MRKELIITVFLIVAGFAHLSCADQRIECEKIAQRTEELLKAHDLEQLYASLSNWAKSSTSKAEFDERANRVIALLRKADNTLNFAKVRDGGVNPDGPVDLYKEFRAVGRGENTVDVEISIDLNLPTRLFDVCVKPTVGLVRSETCLTDALRKI